jgi:hypothetical protein
VKLDDEIELAAAPKLDFGMNRLAAGHPRMDGVRYGTLPLRRRNVTAATTRRPNPR